MDAERHRAYNRARSAANQQYINTIRRERGCTDCGTHEGLLDFDHRPDTIKAFSLGKAGGRSRATIDLEITKCDVRCSPCHQRRHIAEDPEKMIRAGRAGGRAGKGKPRPWQTPEWYAQRKNALL